jgi:general secretion pathway protein G
MPLRSDRRLGFTLIEISIVVAIVAVLAATVIPHFSSSADDAEDRVVRHNIQVLRLQIDLYKLDHKGGAPDGSGDLAQLVSATDVDGNIGAAGPVLCCGPYIGSIPENPYTLSAKVRLYEGSTPPPPSGAPDAGWIYQPSTGGIWCDNPAVIDKY